MEIKLQNQTEVQLMVMRMVFLAWKASVTKGMGFLQAPDAEPTEEEVWERAYTAGDYPGGFKGNKLGSVHCDYVFGRMMKWSCYWKDNTVSISDTEFRSDYQSFLHEYPNNRILVDAAAESLGIQVAEEA